MLTWEISFEDNEFTRKIREVVSRPEFVTAADIGAHTGESSTRCLFEAMRDKPYKRLYALEPQKFAYDKLCEIYKDYEWVIPVNRITLKHTDYDSDEQVTFFYNNYHGSLNRMPLSQVLRVKYEEMEYVKGVEEDGLDWIINHNGCPPDVFFMDGSSYTSTYTKEFPKYYGTKVIILDDTQCMKNLLIRKHLLEDSQYDCVYDDQQFRFGVSIFVKNEYRFF